MLRNAVVLGRADCEWPFRPSGVLDVGSQRRLFEQNCRFCSKRVRCPVLRNGPHAKWPSWPLWVLVSSQWAFWVLGGPKKGAGQRPFEQNRRLCSKRAARRQDNWRTDCEWPFRPSGVLGVSSSGGFFSRTVGSAQKG